MSATMTLATSRLRRSAIDRRDWKMPITFSIVTLAALLLFVVFAPRDGMSNFNLSTSSDFFQIPVISYPTRAGGIVATVLLAAISALTIWLATTRRKVPLWLVAVGAFIGIVAFLGWAGSGATLQVPGLLTGAVLLAVPLTYGALTGVIGERAGVVNIAIEAQLLLGAFSAAVMSSLTGSAYVGLLGAAVAGMLVGAILALFAVKYYVEQVIVGVVVNVLISGLTSFLFTTWLAKDAAHLNDPVRFERIEIPLLSQIPVLGPALFRQSIIVYLVYIAVAVVAFALYRTRWGLRLRAVGEHPKAADTVGINVAKTRFLNVVLPGALAGIGGAFITLGQSGAFSKDMSHGLGYIALAAVIFGRWDPLRATLAALLFGFASNLQNALSVIGSPVPSQFMLMLPYVVTILAVAGFVGRSRGPAADGVPYIK